MTMEYSSHNNSSPNFDVEDNLNLSEIHLSTPLSNTTNDELNEYLRKRLFFLEKENGELKKTMTTLDEQQKVKEMKIQNLEEKLKIYEGYCKSEYPTSTQLANSKIVELAKKLREKNSEIEVVKTKCKRLERLLIAQQEKDLNQKPTPLPEKESSTTIVEDTTELKKLQDKLSHTVIKYHEVQNSNCQLKRDLKLANKWLQQEIGSNFDEILLINNSSSTWRGRAQIICDLQKKNNELKEKLKEYDKSGGDSTTSSTTTLRKDKKLEGIVKENLELKNNYEEIRRKLEIVKARNRVLESEYVILKTKLSASHENSTHDKAYIDQLISQLNSKNDRKGEELKQKDSIIKRLEQENEHFKIDLQKSKCMIVNLTKELEEKSSECERSKNSKSKLDIPISDENGNLKRLNKLEAEHMRLLELLESQNKRLQDERDMHQKTQLHLRVERQRGAKLEANVARLQLEYNSTRSSYRSPSSFRVTEEPNYKDQLELAQENIKVLQTRLELESYERKRDFIEFVKILKDKQ